MLRDANIVCIGGIDWNFNWQVQQEVASAFALAGNRVLFVENTGVRRPEWRDLSRLRSRLTNWRRVRPADPHGVTVHSPLLIPLPYSRLACTINRIPLLRAVRRWIAPASDRPLIVISFLPTPLVRDLVRALDPALVVFYAADRLSESSPGASRLRKHEEAFFRDADLVFTTSDALRNFAESLGARAEMLSHGVRYFDFERARLPDASSAILGQLQRPVVGFAGSVRRQTDIALMTEVAREASELEFVFVGPVLTDVSSLMALPNVHFIAAVPHEAVIRYMMRFDVGILPYVLNAYTAHILPAKLKEYLAAGLPVVATRLPEVSAFAEKHEGVVAFADDASSFVTALRAAVGQRERHEVERRMDVASTYDWRRQIDTMRTSMEAALDRRAGR